MTRVLVAPDKFKESLSAAEVARRLAAGLKQARPGLEVVEVPVADGGEGTVDAAVAAGFDPVAVEATGPTGQPVRTAYARRGDEAVVELAAVSGLGLLPAGPDPLRASSYGTGEVLRAALDAGCRRIVLGIGGSACTDGGAGLVQALGARLLDAQGNNLPPGGAPLADLDRLDLAGLHPALADAELLVASDVDNPLYGDTGSAAVYGPQKGASPEQVDLLDKALRRWGEVVARTTGADRSGTPGAGAAGGVGFGLVGVLDGTLRSGIELVLDLVGLADELARADLVITGEGSLDRQTLHGKAPAGVAQAARRAGVPVVAVAGRSLLAATDVDALGLAAVYALTDLEPDVRRCIDEAAPLLERVAGRVAGDHLPERLDQPAPARL